MVDRHEKVLESCVIGVPDERWGEKVVAAVVVRQGSTVSEKEIRDDCRRHLSDWKCPKGFFSWRNFPGARWEK